MPALVSPPVKPEANGNGVHAEPKAAPQVPALDDQGLERFLVDFVVEQTGYPPEMVELDADLEADLGIDSIKKAQLFGELAEQFSITVDVTDQSLSLDDFPTLRHVKDFLSSQSANTPSDGSQPVEVPAPLAAPPVEAARPSANGTAHSSKEGSASSLSPEELETFLVNFVVEQTGYPPEMVELDADLEADLGIDSIKKAQMMGELAEQFSITVDVTDENLSLDDFPTLRHVCNFLAGPAKAAV
jgi:acyl carrier protein